MHVRTPLIASQALSARLNKPVWLKLENVQPSGSFKLRGIGHACKMHHARGAKGFVSSSGGNAGLAVAYAGRKLGLPVTVVVPETTSEKAKHLIRLEAATVLVHGASWQQAHAHALSLSSPELPLIHPFDDPLLWDGHASMVTEMLDDQHMPELLVCSVGGGGLLSGLAQGLDQHKLHNCELLAIETEGAASFHAALKEGHPVDIGSVNTLATSLGARQVCQASVDWARRRTIHSRLISDEQAIRACQAFLADHRFAVEPACGAALSAVYEPSPEVMAASSVTVIVCGGVSVLS